MLEEGEAKLRSKLGRAKEELEVGRQEIENLVKANEAKEEQLRTMAGGLEELEEKHGEIEKLQEDNRKHNEFADELLEQIKRISEENNRLT